MAEPEARPTNERNVIYGEGRSWKGCFEQESTGEKWESRVTGTHLWPFLVGFFPWGLEPTLRPKLFLLGL